MTAPDRIWLTESSGYRYVWNLPAHQRIEYLRATKHDGDLDELVANYDRQITDLVAALTKIASRKTGGPHAPGQLKAEHREMIEIARAAIAKAAQ